MTMTMKATVFREMTLCSMVDRCNQPAAFAFRVEFTCSHTATWLVLTELSCCEVSFTFVVKVQDIVEVWR
jgi:hypothetical protein